MQHCKQIFFKFCSAVLVFSIDIGLVIMFLQKLWCKFYTKKQHFAKNLHFNTISNVHHTENIEHFLTSEDDKHLRIQVAYYAYKW